MEDKINKIIEEYGFAYIVYGQGSYHIDNPTQCLSDAEKVFCVNNTGIKEIPVETYYSMWENNDYSPLEL